ncbi:MAG: Asp-tRNA(Asn)/Glu-tRNA(Gln) amidotransferase subunit GatC [Granulosicoccaceae bacterium]
MALKEQDIKDIAHLARLGLDDSALAPLAADLSTVLNLVEQMNSINTDGVEPMAHPGNAVLRLRDDNITEPDQREKLQKAAPSTEAGYFLVPRVVE